MTNKKYKILKGISHNLGKKFMSYSCIPLMRRFLDATNQKGGKFSVDIQRMIIKPDVSLDKNAQKCFTDLHEWFIDETNKAKIKKDSINSISIHFEYFPKKFLKIIRYYRYHSSIVVKTTLGEIQEELWVNGWL